MRLEKIEPHLPAWATVEEASAWLRHATGQEWPLSRLIASGVDCSIWLDCADDQAQEYVDHVFLGRREGFRAPVVFASDLERLAFARDEGTLTITRRPDGRPIRFTPPVRFPIGEVRLSDRSVRGIHLASTSETAEGSHGQAALHLGGMKIALDDPGFAQWALLNGGLDGAKIEVLRFDEVHHSTSAIDSETAAAAVKRPLSAQRQQEKAILMKLQELDVDPLRLPATPNGLPGIKSRVRNAIGKTPLFQSGEVFDKAWQRLRDFKSLADG